MTTALLVLLLLVPGGAALAAAGARRRPQLAAAAATSGSALTLLCSVVLLGLTRPWTTGTDTASLDVPWLGLLGSRLHLGWDGISAPLVLLTGALTLACCLYLWFGDDDAQPGESAGRLPHPGLLACLLATETAALATFLARDLLVFVIAFEAVLVPMWVLIHRWGSPARGDNRTAATRFVLYTAVGSAVMLLGVIWLAIACGSCDFAVVAARGPQLPAAVQAGIAALLLVGLGVKVPVWPLHSWLPPAHTVAPTVGSVLLAGVLLKLGSYGLVRVAAGFVPTGVQHWAAPLGLLGVVGIVWGGLICLVERDLKRLVAYSSVAHMGFVALGVAAGTPEGLQGALFVGVAHGVVTSLLFFVVGMLKHRALAAEPADLTLLPAGLRDTHPRLGWMLALGCIAGTGLPGLAGFWGEVLAVLGTWGSPALGPAGPWLAAVAVLGTALAAAYLLRVLYLIWHGRAPEPAEPWARRHDLSVLELSICLPLAVATLALGVQPWLLLSLTGPAVRVLVGAP